MAAVYLVSLGTEVSHSLCAFVHCSGVYCRAERLCAYFMGLGV